MDACGSPRRGKAGKCDARLSKLFADIAPEDAPSRISSGKSGAESHLKRLDDVFGSLNHTLSGAAAPPPPTLAALEAPAPSAPSSQRPAKKPRRKAKNSPRRPPPKPGYTIETLGRPSSAAAERGAAMSFLRELRERKGGGEKPADDIPDDAAPRFRKRPRRAGGAAPPKAAAVSLSHLDDMDDGL